MAVIHSGLEAAAERYRPAAIRPDRHRCVSKYDLIRPPTFFLRFS